MMTLRPGDVELVCGGPPCQGFSALNRFSDRASSQLTNSMIATFLSVTNFEN